MRGEGRGAPLTPLVRGWETPFSYADGSSRAKGVSERPKLGRRRLLQTPLKDRNGDVGSQPLGPGSVRPHRCRFAGGAMMLRNSEPGPEESPKLGPALGVKPPDRVLSSKMLFGPRSTKSPDNWRRIRLLFTLNNICKTERKISFQPKMPMTLILCRKSIFFLHFHTYQEESNLSSKFFSLSISVSIFYLTLKWKVWRI